MKKLKRILIVIIVGLLIVPFLNFSSIDEKQQDKKDFNDKIVLNLYNMKDLSLENYDADFNYDGSIAMILRYNPSHELAPNINSQERLMDYRNQLSEYYLEFNYEMIENLGLADYDSYYASSYGPFVLYKYNSLSDLLENDLTAIKESDSEDLLNVFVENENHYDMATRNPNSFIQNYPFGEALEDIGITSDTTYTGAGVKIGSIESGIPNNYVNLSNTTYETHGTHQTHHAFTTSSVYGGDSGIAPDAEIYFSALSNHSFLESTDWLISRGVNIINRSNGASTGRYSSADAYADYIVKEAKVTFINSAGNSGDTNSVGSPSVGLNVISVASNDVNLGISNFSSAGLTSPSNIRISKPTLTAPGGRISNVDNISGTLSGTSYSAPMVTGVTALLMEEFNDLKYNPENVISILTNSTNYALGQIEEFDHDAGFGIVNYQNARKNYLNTHKMILTNSVTNNDLVLSQTVTIPFGNTIHASTFTMYNSEFTTPTGIPNIDDIQYSQFVIRLVNNHTGSIIDTSHRNSNFSSFSYSNSNPNHDSFTINVFLNGDKATNRLEHYAFSYYVNDDFDVNIHVSSGNKVDIPPTFKWIEKDLGKYSPYQKFDLVFLNNNKNEILRLSGIGENQSVLSVTEWGEIISAIGSNYYVYVAGYPTTTSTISKRISALYSFAKPNTFSEKYIIYPSNYGYEQQYFFYEKYKRVTVGSFSFDTNRLRTGYIEQEYINLSPRRSGAGTAYLEYKFSKKVYRIDVDLSFWSASEYIYPSNATAVLQYKDEFGNWVTALDLLRDISLSKDRYNQDTYSIVFPNGTYEYRYYMTADAIGNRNKGRISIGNTILYT